MNILSAIYLTCQLTILPPAALSLANPGVLERVAERRMSNNWGLERQDLSHFDAFVAPSDCDLLGKTGTLIIGDNTYTVISVDCENRENQLMEQRGLLADINLPELVHKQGILVFYN